MFRETALEYTNCGKTIYSRIARVCAQDNGGSHKFRLVLILCQHLNCYNVFTFISSRWTSFTKARLNCSVPGDFPFYFDEIRE